MKEEGGEEGECEFAAGDTVRVDLDLDSAKLLQEGHGGWTDGMNGVSHITNTYRDSDCHSRKLLPTVFTLDPVDVYIIFLDKMRDKFMAKLCTYIFVFSEALCDLGVCRDNKRTQ